MKIIHLFICIFLSFSVYATTKDNVTGTWEYHGPAESGVWLKTLQTGNSVRFQLEISNGEPQYNSGWIEGEFTLIGTSGTFKSSKYSACVITFDFKKSTVLVAQQQIDFEDNRSNDCGFGYGVVPNNTLTIKNHEKPKFSERDPRFN